MKPLVLVIAGEFYVSLVRPILRDRLLKQVESRGVAHVAVKISLLQFADDS